MGLGDVYELTDIQTYAGKEIVNVYFYRQYVIITPAINVATELASRWRDQILPSIAAAQNTQVVHTDIKVRNLFNDADQAELLINVPGTVTLTSNENMPRFVSARIELNAAGGAVKDGSKALGGIGEGYGLNGVISNGSLQGLLITAAAKMREIVSEAVPPFSLSVFEPVIVKRVRSGTSGNYTYRLPTSISELAYGAIMNSIARFVLSTTNSRKG